MRRNASASSLVKMSFVTTVIDISPASNRHSAATSAVLPLPTGPPMPMRSGRSPGPPAAGTWSWLWPGAPWS